MPTVTPRPDPITIKPVPGRRHEVRRWLWRVTTLVAVLVPTVLVLAALGSKFGVWDWRFGLGFLTAKLGLWLSLSSIFLGALCLLSAVVIRPRGKRALAAGLIALVTGLVALAMLGGTRGRAGDNPFHDVSTDTQNPPAFRGRIVRERAGLNTLDYVGKTATLDGREELVSVIQTRIYPDLRTVVSSRAPGDALVRAEAVADSLGWNVADVEPSARGGGRVEATDTTFWYGFKDDIVIRVRPGAGGGSVVDVRSVSRVGASDLGANAERVRDFIDAFEG